jgi:hypothetical protein
VKLADNAINLSPKVPEVPVVKQVSLVLEVTPDLTENKVQWANQVDPVMMDTTVILALQVTKVPKVGKDEPVPKVDEVLDTLHQLAKAHKGLLVIQALTVFQVKMANQATQVLTDQTVEKELKVDEVDPVLEVQPATMVCQEKAVHQAGLDKENQVLQVK